MSTGYRMPFPMWPQLAAFILAIVGMGVFHLVGVVDDLSSPLSEQKSVPPASAQRQPPQASPFLGSPILKNYAKPTQPPQQDITDLSNALSNFALLIKGDQPIPLGANEEIAAALLGKNKTKTIFLPADAPCFNTQGQIVDRWQTPLFFHVLDHGRIDIRSAGPDKEMWTTDDLHRHYDGQFIRGEALNSPSLLDATLEYRGR